MPLTAHLDIKPELKEALARHHPVVALESTIISHGMPYPENMDIAFRVEKEVRANGAFPATIALMDGVMKVGLTPEEIGRIAEGGISVGKAGRRDIPHFLVSGRSAGTTVSATMAIAAMAGIRVFATGGIGGVHRGAHLSLDVSADLTEFSQSPVAVVSAGAKAILDLPATLEYLETLSVPVWGFGTNEFPAFYSVHSGIELEVAFQDVHEMARALHLHWSISPITGALIANPIPIHSEIAAMEIEPLITRSLHIAEEKGIRGKQITPFLLASLAEISAGRTQRANVEIILNNARLGAILATSLHGLDR